MMQQTRDAVEPFPEVLVERLQVPAAHPLDRSADEGVEYLQTHISHLFLRRERVYKFRKAIELPFLTFATRIV
jgi:aminoglycoside phosphotransferase family enzyme